MEIDGYILVPSNYQAFVNKHHYDPVVTEPPPPCPWPAYDDQYIGDENLTGDVYEIDDELFRGGGKIQIAGKPVKNTQRSRLLAARKKTTSPWKRTRNNRAGMYGFTGRKHSAESKAKVSKTLKALKRKRTPEELAGLRKTCEERRLKLYGFRERLNDNSEYMAYHNALKRCTDKTSSDWPHYGGRGIKFKFTSFSQFMRTVGAKPNPKLTLDRVDVDGHYEPGNVRWATMSVQNSNKRKWFKRQSKGGPVKVRNVRLFSNER